MKKKIALLNFPLDNNYGGNMQRYALMYVLQNMGYDVTHLQTRFRWLDYCPSYFKLFKRYIKWLLGMIDDDHAPAWIRNYKFEKTMRYIYPFYNHYIKHTEPIYSYDELSNIKGYDLYLVGSDQVWRRSMNGHFPYQAMFFDFVKDKEVKKVAYGVSLGNSDYELNEQEWTEIKKLYENFSAVSVREDSAISIFEHYGWIHPQAVQVLDPTLLVDKSIYEKLVMNAKTVPSNGQLFCYVLDKTPEVQKHLSDMIQAMGKKPYTISSNGAESIEQWIRSFMDAEYVITDSFHGMLFSLIFKKPFKLLYNKRRGNARFESMLRLLQIDVNSLELDWTKIDIILQSKREESLMILRNAIEE